MADQTNDQSGQNTGNEGNIDSSIPNDVTSDPVLLKHLDIAIEAQDGPKDKNAEAKSGSETKEGDDAAKGGKAPAADSTGGKKDGTAQPDTNKEGEKNKGATSGPKDLVVKGGGDNGTDLVIKAGPERRFYEQLQVARQRGQFTERELTSTQQALQTLQTKHDALERSVQQTSSLPPAQLATAVRMYGDLQRDPAGTLKKLLAEAVSLGHTVDGIGQGVDVAAITAAVRAELAAKETAQEPTEADITAQVDREINSFYSRFPDARVHDALLGAVIRDHPDLSLESAYFQLKDGFAQKNFDWSLSLDDNVKAASGAPTQEPTNTNTGKPLPSGGGSPNGSGSEPLEKHKDVVMSETLDYEDIVKSAMRENGLQI